MPFHNPLICWAFILMCTGCLSSRGKDLTSPIGATGRDSKVSDEELTKVNEEIDEIEGLQLTAKVKSGNNKGYWSTGMIVGRYGKFEYRGEFFVSEHLQFDLGALLRQPDRLYYTPYRVLIALYKKSVKGSILGMNRSEPVVLRYVRKNPLNPFTISKSPYFAYQVDRLSARPSTFPSQFLDTETGKGSAGEGYLYGRIVRVDRWGVFGKTCTMFLHQGKAVSDGVSNITPMNLYTEEGCRFVERLASTGTHARFYVSFQPVAGWNRHRGIVHEICLDEYRPNVACSPDSQPESSPSESSQQGTVQ